MATAMANERDPTWGWFGSGTKTSLSVLFSNTVFIILSRNSSMLLLLFPSKSCYYAQNTYTHFIIEKSPQKHYLQCHVHTNCLSQLFILAAITDGQNFTVLVVLLASLS